METVELAGAEGTGAVGAPATIERVDAAALPAMVPGLARLLRDTVAGNASVSFMADLDETGARAWWEALAPDIARGSVILLVAREGSSVTAGSADEPAILGTVHLFLIQTPNQPHRCEVRKLLVHSPARRRGLGRALMQAIETEALRAGRSLLVLDTVVGSAGDHLYRGIGYEEAGVIPGFALNPDGTMIDTVIFYKHLA